MIEEYLSQLHPGQWFGFDGEKTYENLWVKGYEKPTLEEIQQGIENQKKARLKQQAQAEAERIATAEIVQERIKNDPYLSAIANVESKIESGEINENASKAIREELGK